MSKDPISADKETSSLTIPHTGITMRTLLAVANNCNPKQHRWKILYKDYVIGEIRIVTSKDK